MSDNNDFTHEIVIYNSDNNNGTRGTGKFLLYDDNINALKVEDIDNIKIGGGANGRVLATDGEGNLRWISAAAVTGGVSSYNDLDNLPDLSIYAQTANLATVATTGSYADLTNKPSLFSGSYADLTNKPSLFSGSYADLTNKPTIPTVPTNVSAFVNDAGYLTSVTNITGNAGTVSNGVYTNGSYANPAWITSLAYSKLTDAPDLATVATSGAYADLSGKPNLATVATTGSYSDLTNRPTIFSGNYADLANKPVLFDGAYLSLTGRPNLAQVAISGSYDDLSNKPSIPSLTGYATEAWVNSQGFGSGSFTGNYNDLTNKPNLFSGSYNDLTNKPSIPTVPTDVSAFNNDSGYITSSSLAGYATEAWVNSQGFGSGSGASTGNWGFSSNVAYNSTSADQGLYIAPGGESTSYVYVPGNSESSSGAVQVSNSAPTGRVVVAVYNKNWQFDADGLLTVPSNGAGIKWNNPDEPPMPLGGWLANSSIAFDKDLGIVFSNGVGGAGGFSWILGKDGKLKLPVGGDIVDSNGASVLGGGSGPTNEITNTDPEGPTYSVSVGTDGVVTMVTSRGNLEFGALPEPGAPTHFHIMRPAGQEGSSDLYFGDDYNYVKLPSSSYSQQGVEIGSSLNQGAVGVWRFGTDGNLTTPGNIYGPNNGSTLVLGQAVDSNNAFVSIPSFADGGELLTIQNNFNAETGGIQVNTNGYLDLNGKTVNLNGSTSITAIAGSVQWRFNNDGRFQLPTNGIIQQNGSYTRTTTPGINGATTNEVVWTSLFNDISSAKLTIQLETNEVDDTTGWHTQVCEAIIASRGAGPGGDPVMTVYGVTYTSTVPLATFTVQRNPATQRIEVVATRTAATVEGISFRINSVEMKTRD